MKLNRKNLRKIILSEIRRIITEKKDLNNIATLLGVDSPETGDMVLTIGTGFNSIPGPADGKSFRNPGRTPSQAKGMANLKKMCRFINTNLKKLGVPLVKRNPKYDIESVCDDIGIESNVGEEYVGFEFVVDHRGGITRKYAEQSVGKVLELFKRKYEPLLNGSDFEITLQKHTDSFDEWAPESKPNPAHSITRDGKFDIYTFKIEEPY